MATYDDILTNAAALLNDQNQTQYTDAVMLPHLNTALSELQEVFELNNIPVTNDTSATLDVPAGTTAIGFATTPALPADLIEIQELFESQDGQNNWIRMSKKEYLTNETLPSGTQLSSFRVWAWEEQEIKLLSAIVPIDIKIDYVKSLFPVLAIGGLSGTLAVINTMTVLEFRVAGLVAEFIMEDLPRATSLNSQAGMALDRSIGISVKGKQIIVTRRRPFRASYKRRGVLL